MGFSCEPIEQILQKIFNGSLYISPDRSLCWGGSNNRYQIVTQTAWQFHPYMVPYPTPRGSWKLNYWNLNDWKLNNVFQLTVSQSCDIMRHHNLTPLYFVINSLSNWLDKVPLTMYAWDIKLKLWRLADTPKTWWTWQTRDSLIRLRHN